LSVVYSIHHRFSRIARNKANPSNQLPQIYRRPAHFSHHSLA
jgi:hypothetical protein